jgi:hypothetical protein
VTFPLEGKLYHPRHIAIGLGIATEPERAEYYIDVDKNRLKGIWRNRIMVGNLEHVYVTPIPVSVAHAVADHGSVWEKLP